MAKGKTAATGGRKKAAAKPTCDTQKATEEPAGNKTNKKETEYILSIKDYVSDKLEKLQANADKFDGTMDTVIGMLGDAGKALKLPPLYDDLLKIGSETMKTANEYKELTDKIKESSTNEKDAAINVDYVSTAVDRLHLPMQSVYKNFQEMEVGLAEAGIKGQDFRDVFEGIGVVARATNLKPEQFAEVSKTMQEMAKNGPVTAKEMKDLTGEMPQAAKLAAQSMHMSSGDFEKALNKGIISGKAFVENFAGTIRQHFASAMQSASNSVGAKVVDMQNAFEGLKIGVGNALMPIYNSLLSVIGKLLEGFKTVFDWASKNKPILNVLAAAIAGVATGIMVYNVVTKAGAFATTTYSNAIKFAKLMQSGLNTVMKENPIGLVVSLLAGLVTALVYCYNHCKTFKAVVLGVWETIKEFGALASDVFKSIEHVIHGAFTLNWDEVKKGFDQGVSVISNAGSRLGNAFKKGYDGGMKDDVKEGSVADAAMSSGDAKMPLAMQTDGGIGATHGGKTVNNTPTITPGAETKGATGNKSTPTTINIKIGDLVKELNIHSTTIQSGAKQIQQLITEVLLGAVNDSQRIAHD